MARMPSTLKASLIACAVPGALVVLLATLGAVLGWGTLSFTNATFYLILLIATWCPLSKLIMWRVWRREQTLRVACVPIRQAEHTHAPATRAFFETYKDYQHGR